MQVHQAEPKLSAHAPIIRPAEGSWQARTEFGLDTSDMDDE